jgi:hypothetical protein
MEASSTGTRRVALEESYYRCKVRTTCRPHCQQMSRGTYRTSHLALTSILLKISGVRGAYKCRSSQVENWGRRRNITGRRHCFGGGARFEWDMATDIGTYQGGIIGCHTPISLLCAEGEWHVVGLHTYEVAQGNQIAT